MDEHPDRRTLLIVAALVIGGTVLVSSVFLGGQTSKILSTVGASVGNSGEVVGISGSGGGPDPAATAPPTTGTAGGQIADLAAAPPTLLIVRTGTLELEVADLAAATRGAGAAVLQAGGYVSASNQAADAGDASAVVTYRIPSARWDATLTTLHGLAATVRSEQIETEEVTGQVVDLGARIANLRATEAALQAIMAQATEISDVLDVQEQLTTTRGEIEKLVADKAHLEDQASFGSLTVTFRLPARSVPVATPTPPKGWDPAADVAAATGRLVRIGQASATAGIWLGIVGLPLLIGGAVLAFAGWQAYRLGRWIVQRREAAGAGPRA
jgi:hypothetical protein